MQRVASLIDKSLLQETEQEDGEPRFVMLETIREYGVEALAAHGEVESSREGHATYYLRFSEKAEPELVGPQQVTWLDRLEREHDNLRTAVGWLIEQKKREAALRLAMALSQFWEMRGHVSEGYQWLERALIGSEAVKEGIAKTLYFLARVAFSQSDYNTAHTLYEESLILFSKVNNLLFIPICLEGWAGVVCVQGRLVRAAQLWGAAESFRNTIDVPWPIHPSERAIYGSLVNTARAQLGEKAFAAAWAQGRTMTLGQALSTQEPTTMTIEPSSVPPTKPLPIYPDGLTAREVEVLHLVAEGLTDAQVAEQLVISPRTVNTHLKSIYGKIQVTSRSAATRYAMEHQLV